MHGYQQFFDRKFSSFIEGMEASVSSEHRKLQSCSENEDEKNCVLESISTAYFNIAIGQFELGLHRKCFKSCEKAIASIEQMHSPVRSLSTSLVIRIKILMGKSLKMLGKISEAIDVWKAIAIKLQSEEESTLFTPIIDVSVVLDLQQLLLHDENWDSREVELKQLVGSIDKVRTEQESSKSKIEKKIEMPTALVACNSTDEKPVNKILFQKNEPIRKLLNTYYKDYVGESKNHYIQPQYLHMMRLNLPHSIHDELVDDLVSLAYIFINSNQREEAEKLFQLILSYREDAAAAIIGLGSIHAMQREYKIAISDFTKAILIDSNIADAWKRRGQTRAAAGMVCEAISDLSRAAQLSTSDPDIFLQRGLVFHQVKDYKSALIDFKAAKDQGLRTATIMNYIGMCEGLIGHVSKSISAHSEAVKLDCTFREAHLNIALMQKETGDWKNALTTFDAAIKAHESLPFYQAFMHRSQLHYSLGNLNSAFCDAHKAISQIYELEKVDSEKFNSNSAAQSIIQCLTRIANCYQSHGNYCRAVQYFDLALSVDPTNTVWFQREICLIYWRLLTESASTFSIDDKTDPRLKDGCCKQLSQNICSAADTQNVQLCCEWYQKEKVSADQYCIVSDFDHVGDSENSTSSDVTEIHAINDLHQKQRLIDSIVDLGSWVQLRSPGFLPNRRQHRMFGLAILQMATVLRKHINLIRLEGVGVEIPNSTSSRESKSPSEKDSNISNPRLLNKELSPSKSGKRGIGALSHQFGWRDFFDVVVRWRQISEPNDPVWWIDRFPSQAFADGFGLQTPIVNGQLKTVRYYPYFGPSFSLVKKLLRDGYWTASDRLEQVSPETIQAIQSAASLDTLYAAVGEDFYVIVPAPSMLGVGSAVLEGTRITLVKSSGESKLVGDYETPGFEFTIRTPGKPFRWSQFEKELDACFSRLEDTLLSVPPTVDHDSARDDELLSKALQLFYWWVTFAPLSRGTAACGYAALQAVLVSSGRRIDKPIPEGKQLDWEAILAKDCAHFVSKVKPWFEPLARFDSMALMSTDLEKTDIVGDPDIVKFTRSLKDMIELLLLPYPSTS